MDKEQNGQFESNFGKLATFPSDGPTGGFFFMNELLPW
jgi:hypothetical protein